MTGSQFIKGRPESSNYRSKRCNWKHLKFPVEFSEIPALVSAGYRVVDLIALTSNDIVNPPMATQVSRKTLCNPLETLMTRIDVPSRSSTGSLNF